MMLIVPLLQVLFSISSDDFQRVGRYVDSVNPRWSTFHSLPNSSPSWRSPPRVRGPRHKLALFVNNVMARLHSDFARHGYNVHIVTTFRWLLALSIASTD